MKIMIATFFRPSGTVGRAVYAVTGLVGFAFKHNLDRLIATFGFHRQWSLFNYWMPVRDVVRVTQLTKDEAIFLATMVGAALPFIWIGIVLTIKRLRSAHLPVSLAALFFVPYLNLIFFLVLSLIPEHDVSDANDLPSLHAPSPLARVIPESPLGSAAISLLITVPVGLVSAFLGTRVLMNYGWGLFVALPFMVGLVAVLIYGIPKPRSLRSCIGVACLSVTILGGLLFALAIEGVFCLVMAMPLALPLAALGGVCGYGVQNVRRPRHDSPAFLAALLLFAPGVQWIEHIVAVPSPTLVVRSHIDIQAPPEKVWHEVIAFTEIPPPTEWMFQAGIAYPVRAQMFGTGPGAERHCVFSTGSFVEPIQVWDSPRLLKFSVTSNPPPMEEWTPYSHIEPPHLHGFLVSEGGQFLLTPLPNGGTRLEGTTWYKHGLWPSVYWKIWSDAIIHRIHMRVLNHIREEAERRVDG